MKRATSYSRTNGLQRRDAKQIIDEFAPLIRWRADGRDSLLDIGCGCGDVTIDYIRPLLPQNYSRLIGADLSEQMLGVARKRYDHMNISFNKIDIGGDLKEFLPNDWKPVDHVTSFYCLHWVHDQQRAVKNIYDLLTPNGDCLLAFLASTRSVDVYMEMAKMPKWAPYMADVELTIAPFQNSEDAAEEFTTILKNGKFKDCHVVVWDLDYIFVGVDDLKGMHSS